MSIVFKPLNISQEIKEKITKKLDPKIIKQKDGFNYIAGHSCIDLLNSVFGHMWSFDILEQWIEPGVPFFVKDNNKHTAPDETATFNEYGVRGAYVEQKPTIWCKVKLTVYLTGQNGDMFPISKTAFGSQMITGSQTTQANTGYKGAQTDALKKAATLFGIGLELYRDDSEKSFFNDMCKEDKPVIFTDEIKEKYKNELDRLKVAADKFQDPNNALAYYVNLITKGYTSDLNKMPIEYLGELISTVEKIN